MQVKRLNISRVDLAEAVLRLEGKDYNLSKAPFYRDIINNEHQRLVMATARQVFKTTTGAVDTILDSVLIPHFKTMYISPSAKQTKQFSKSRLQKLHDYSPLLRKIAKIVNPSVWDKSYSNGSENYFTYAGDSPDRIRGYSTDSNKFDEMQDIVYRTVVPVANETLSMSDYKKEYYAGTHKTKEGPLMFLWNNSTQCVWLVKCDGCNKHNKLDSVDNIGLRGPICRNCGKAINPRLGFWHPLNYDKHLPYEQQLWGYHISQLMLPKNCEVEREWQALLTKRRMYDETRFMNEVLGVATATGARFLEREDLLRQCRDYRPTMPPNPAHFRDIATDSENRYEIYAGIDWSGGGLDSRSLTVLWIFGVLPSGALKTLYFKIFEKREPYQDIQDILHILRAYKVKFVGADAGVGAHANSFLREEFGSSRVQQFQYGQFRQHYSQAVDRIHVNKTAAIDSFFSDVKRQLIYYPHADMCTEAFDHVMSVFSMITKHGAGVKIWNSSPGTSDDALHAQVFGWLAARIGTGRVVLYDAYPSSPDDE